MILKLTIEAKFSEAKKTNKNKSKFKLNKKTKSFFQY